MKKLLLYILFITQAVIFFGQNFYEIKNPDEKVFIKFKFHQTTFQVDNYYFFSDSLEWLDLNKNKFVVKPDTTTKMYIFKANFTVDENLQNIDLAIFVGATNFPCYVYINQILIGRIGSYKELYSSHIHPYYEFVLSPQILKFGQTEINEIQIQAYPKYNEVIPLDNIFISSFRTVSTYTFWRNFSGPKFTQVVTIFAFILFIYFLIGYYMKRDRSDKKYIYFAFLCLCFAFGYSNMVFSWNVVPQLTILKLARSGLSFANLFLVLFTISFTNILNNKKYFKIILFVPQAIVVLLVWLQPNVFAVEKIVAMFVNILIPPYLILSFVLSFIVLIKEFKKRYLVFFIGFCMLLFAIAIDSINYSAQIIPYTWYIILGYFSVIISIFFILAREQADVFHLSLDRAQELEEIKDKLEEKVVLRTAEIDKQREEIQVQAEVLQETNTSLKHINDQLNTKNIEIEHKNKEIIIKNQTLTSQKNNIISSLHYASRIQTAVLPHKDYIDNLFPNNFILYKPKDIVSGDFYFVKKINSHILIAVADCTGHGVPGAFMSMLGIALLNEIVIKADVNSTAKVLEELRSQLKLALGQIGKVGEQQDGMDISLVAINTQNNMLQFSGAYIPLWIFKKDDSIIEFKGDKMPIGIHPKDNEFFTTHNTEISKGDCLYMFTDGYSSQLASENNETFKIKRLRDLFSEIYHLRIDFQKDILETNFNGWKNHKEQTDDVLVLGVKV